MTNKLFHRFDDIGYYYKNTEYLLCKLDELNIPSILAVIPTQLDKRVAQFIMKLRNCFVFQHGYSHINRQENQWNDEFPSSMARTEIAANIKAGKCIIEENLSCKVIGYVPPWNNTSKQTIDVLEELHFKIYSSQKNNSPITTLKTYDIGYDTNHAYGSASKLKILDHLKENIDNQSNGKLLTGVMYHPYFYTKGDVKKVIKFIESFKDSNISYDVMKSRFSIESN